VSVCCAPRLLSPSPARRSHPSTLARRVQTRCARRLAAQVAFAEGVTEVDPEEASGPRSRLQVDDLKHVPAATVAFVAALRNGEDSDVTAIKPARVWT
jgi:hypothetical protein